MAIAVGKDSIQVMKDRHSRDRTVVDPGLEVVIDFINFPSERKKGASGGKGAEEKGSGTFFAIVGLAEKRGQEPFSRQLAFLAQFRTRREKGS
jgi:hypothetical protein